MRYALAGDRSGFNILSTDEARAKPDGYTEVWRGERMVGLYKTAMLTK